MDLLISNSSPLPIYEQITTQLKEKILTGELAPGEMLPSLRGLARALQISVITVQRAYDDLQRDGFVESVAGKGTFVAAQNKDFMREEKLRQIEDYLAQAVSLARTYGIPADQLKTLIDLFYTEE